MQEAYTAINLQGLEDLVGLKIQHTTRQILFKINTYEVLKTLQEARRLRAPAGRHIYSNNKAVIQRAPEERHIIISKIGAMYLVAI
ncbi:hypothetical protein [Flavobacterium subsaxonicum]|uniref:Uncharacterized protein n=1 Tax=Flavobacterium subsaxonicum WB 4.1-42 = DSM 21790 TaxID=1121898 RepID=A0A0A2MHA5_9FLAO|nr:hypothetical protein [Flavobacterium subsaxonicum]KGO91006.1 hypothetical protein Q766_20430 [Flavobacterium subsaxonicum WB 4.1-42 = DSM 21790]